MTEMRIVRKSVGKGRQGGIRYENIREMCDIFNIAER